ncbi:hypothetical protein OH491_24845 [Termitidicoccus mucosus]|uniref:DUF2399 domain-containing protein n=1 Tax=Termitidicoccus mucosus TaxID=1184151 RepID=A0A178IQW2_9BACT|nr:hypothetical protein AW736_01685 [Opitutaceae bacterium TSB47]
MKEKFIDREFTPRTLKIIRQADAITQDYEAQGYDLSVRQLFYQFVARNILANTQHNYNNLASVISDARMAGLISWGCIKDRNRITRTVSAFETTAHFLQAANETYRKNKWRNQANHIEVFVEKQALEGVLLPICERWEVPFTANKGYSSSSSMYERGKFIQSMRDVEGKTPHIIYLGDHDPSGIDMSRDVEKRLTLFSDGRINFHRIALNKEQIDTHNLPENPAKTTDSRAGDYIARFGTSSWELDALNPDTLHQIVTRAITALVDLPAWERDTRTETEEKNQLQDIIEELTQR